MGVRILIYKFEVYVLLDLSNVCIYLVDKLLKYIHTLIQ